MFNRAIVVPLWLVLGTFVVFVCTVVGVFAAASMTRAPAAATQQLIQYGTNGCSEQFPYLLAQSTISALYLFDGKNAINKNTGEVIVTESPDEESLWLIHAPGQAFSCISWEFVDRIYTEFKDSIVPPLGIPDMGNI